MITKEYINELKAKGNVQIEEFIKKQNDVQTILFILENLGRLPENFDGNWLVGLLDNSNSKVRYWAIKNIGKLKKPYYLPILTKSFETEQTTDVRSEIISAIGRMHNPKSKAILLTVLDDNDPKIVCQAIRGLLVFKNDKEVCAHLKKLINHENELVKSLIQKEFFEIKENIKTNLPHPETYEYLKNVVVNGDVREILDFVPNESIHLTFTSPPYYNARDYSIYPSYQSYLDFLSEVFKATHRITKEGRFLIVNTSPIIIPRISRAHSSKRYPIPFDIHSDLVKNGWEFIDDIIWLKPEASVKNRNAGFLQHRKPLAYKPNAVTEYLMVYRKKTSKLIDWNLKQYDNSIIEKSKVTDGYETSNIWKIDPTFNKVHSAVFPFELCKRVLQYYSFEGDLVFDPFAGSGTLGITAKKLHRNFFLTEKDKKYFEYIKLMDIKNSSSLFKDKETKFYTLEQFVEMEQK